MKIMRGIGIIWILLFALVFASVIPQTAQAQQANIKYYIEHGKYTGFTVDQLKVDALQLGTTFDTLEIDTNTVTVTQSVHYVKAEGAADNDTITTITGAEAFDMIWLVGTSLDTLFFLDAGSFLLGAERVLNDSSDVINLLYDGSKFREVGFYDND